MKATLIWTLTAAAIGCLTNSGAERLYGQETRIPLVTGSAEVLPYFPNTSYERIDFVNIKIWLDAAGTIGGDVEWDTSLNYRLAGYPDQLAIIRRNIDITSFDRFESGDYSYGVLEGTYIDSERGGIEVPVEISIIEHVDGNQTLTIGYPGEWWYEVVGTTSYSYRGVYGLHGHFQLH